MRDLRLDRRGFAKLALGSLAALAVPGCGSGLDYTDADRAALERQRREEAAASGRGPLGPLRFQGYRGLADLPYFELAPDGALRLAVEIPAPFDFHTHLGIAVLFAPAIDLQARTPRTVYLLDCDGSDPGCPFDLDVYQNANFSEAAHAALEAELRDQGLPWGSAAARTHTLANLLAELDAMGGARAAVLGMALGLPWNDRVTETWMQAIAESPARDRFVPFASVHPRDAGWRAKLRGFAARGARGVKLHPEMQRFAPDDPEAMEIYAECERLGLPVIFHAGRSGIEPEWMRPYALIRHYTPAIEAFPRVQFLLGHAGARDVADAVTAAQRYPNVWLEIACQGATQLAAILDTVGPERVVFGSDWPFYPLAATLAKVLLVTEGRPAARAAILQGNAERVFAAAAATRA
ncbi:MAG: amidohydrolase [Proteobacteria bacterium]|nr:MAG: amidohydrolase [Pseudomonadota bacterium]